MPPKKKGLKRERSEDDLSSAVSSAVSSPLSTGSALTYQTTGTADALINGLNAHSLRTPERIRTAMITSSPGVPLQVSSSENLEELSDLSDNEKKKKRKTSNKRKKAKKGGRKTKKRKSRKN